MKKILFVGLFLIFSTSTFSQGKSKLGVMLGVNKAKVLNTGLETKTGMYAGLLLAISISDHYTLQPEIQYSNQGGKSSFGNEEELDIHYISLGLSNKFYPGKDRGFHFILGPSLNFNIEDNFINLINDTGNNLEITPIDVAIHGGIGYEFDFGLSLELRYKQGLVDLDFNDSEEYGSSEEQIQLNRVIQIGLAYKFNM